MNNIKKQNEKVNTSSTNNFNSLIETLDFYKQYLEETLEQDKNDEFISCMNEFRSFLKNACMISSGYAPIYGQFKEKDCFYIYRTFFMSSENFHERLIEITEKDNILLKQLESDTIKDYLSLDYNQKFYNDIINEFQSIDMYLSKSKKFIMVGCGSFPLTLFSIREKYSKLDIVGIDNSPEAIINAKTLVRKLMFSNIKFDIIDGINYDYSDIDTVFIANLVMPKTKVLKRIAMTCKSGTLILLRVPVMYGTLLSEDVNYMELQSFNLVKEVIPTKDTDDILYKLLVLIKK